MNNKLLPQAEFLKYYRIEEENFVKTGIVWNELEDLFNHYILLIPELESIGETMSNRLMKVSKVHSVRYRVKHEEHLIEKIIRKRIQNPDRVITTENYLSEITDLVGVRAIHLFKEDWESIHTAIQNIWELKEIVRAYIRVGDNESIREALTKKGLEVKEHLRGYRSIHYIASTKPAKTEYFTEIQVRTIFEEGWSEIDHSISYPYELDNLLYKEFSLILNRLAGSADEMGSFITLLRNEITQHNIVMSANQKEIEKLQAIIDKSDLNDNEKVEVKKGLANVATQDSTGLLIYGTTLPQSIAHHLAGLNSVSRFSGLNGISSNFAKAMEHNLSSKNSLSEILKRNSPVNLAPNFTSVESLQKIINSKAVTDKHVKESEEKPSEEEPPINE